MPNRVIKESIKRSPQIDALTWFEEVVYYRLMVTADDYGCMDGRTVLLKNELFPLKESVTKKAVEDAISKLVSVGLLCRYTANDMPYLFFPTWGKHQRLRNKNRKYPNPEEFGLTVTCPSNDGQMTDIGHSEIESESESEIEKENNSTELPSAPPVLTLLLNDGSEFEIREQDVAEWQETFPNVDVMQQLRSMKLWCRDNPKKRKTKNGIRRFVTNWLDREQNRGGDHGPAVTSAPTPKKPADASKREKGPDFLPEWAD